MRVEPNRKRPDAAVVDVRVGVGHEAGVGVRTREDVLVDELLKIDPRNP